MEMTGEQLIHASQADTWAALNDTEVTKACVRGCESIERASETDFVVQMTARIGPVSAKFKGKMTLSNLKPPHSYSIAFEGQGGVAGFAKGSADVSLVPEGHDTHHGSTGKAGPRASQKAAPACSSRPIRRIRRAPASPTTSRRTSAASSRRSARAW